MPIFYQHIINADTKLGVWKITEVESFFLRRVPLQREISHPHKRLQHLAGRYLLQHLFPGFPYELMEIADTRKPYLSNEAIHFSISHCGDYAAAIASKTGRVGVDVELVKPVIQKIQHKFLDRDETALLTTAMMETGLSYAALLTACWSAKEAIFKWYGNGGMDFKKHMQLVACTYNGDGSTLLLQVLFAKEAEVLLNVTCAFSEEFMLAWVVS